MSTQRKLNEKLYLNLQLSDGTASMPKRVFVNLYTGDGTLAASNIELSHVGGGEFKEDTVTMPDVENLTAQYVVYESDGVTVDLAYNVGKDIFMRDYSAELVDSTLTGSITKYVTATIEGELNSGELQGDIESNSNLEVSIIESNLEGELNEC